MKKILLLCVLIGLFVVFSESASYGFSMNINPPSLGVSVKPGESTGGTITVTNNAEEDIGILVYMEDWLYDSSGRKSFYAAGTTPFSCAKWIRVFPKKFRVEGGGNMGVQYTINVPEDAEGGYYAVIFFESIPVGEIEGKEGLMVRFSGRLGTIVYLDTEGKSVRKGSVESLSITPPRSDKPLKMNLSFKNTGNVHINAKGILNIIDEEGNVFGKEKFGPLNALAGDMRETEVEWFGELEEGTYYAIVTLDIGTEEPIVEEREFSVFFGGTINALSIDISKRKPSFSVLVENAGHLNIEAGGRIDVLKDDKVVKSLNLKKSLIAPGKEKELKGVLDEKLPQGMYTAKAVISIGAKEFIKEEVFSIE